MLKHSDLGLPRTSARDRKTHILSRICVQHNAVLDAHFYWDARACKDAAPDVKPIVELYLQLDPAVRPLVLESLSPNTKKGVTANVGVTDMAPHHELHR